MSNFMVRWLKLSLVVIVGCGFLAMMIYALLNRDEISSSQVEPPLISPPSEPLKRRPDQPGGMQIPNRDKLVFDLLDSSNTTLGDTGVGMPVEATPTDVTGMPTALVSDSTEAVKAVGMDVMLASATTPVEHVKAPVAVSASDVMARVVEMKPVVTVAPKVETKAPEPKAEPKVVEKPVQKSDPKADIKADNKAAKAKADAEAKAAAEKPASGGKWAVQLAAVNSVADGNTLTAKVVKEFPALKGLAPRVTPVPNAKKFRVQFTGLKDREAAAGVCAKLNGKQPCFPVNLQ